MLGTKNQQEKAVNWRERTTPAQPGEIADAMLDPVGMSSLSAIVSASSRNPGTSSNSRCGSVS